jgi:hypothetical protein
VLREYVANSRDSHIVCGKADRPVEITLPSIFDPVLKIRDFGNGLSHEDMFQVFCVYGESTKTNSNEVVGNFGIGAKCAFAYSASFQITSIFNQIKSIYNAYLDETECGKLALLTQYETDEESGIEISINVNQSDINTFVNTAAQLFRFWKPYPIFKGNDSFKKIEPNYFLLRENQWGFLNESDYYNRSSGILMGDIFYKMESHQIPDLTELQKKILEKNLVIFAKIGDINVSASREVVSYTNFTINFIKSRLKTIEEEIRIEADKKQAALNSEYEARKLYFDLFNTAGQFGVLAELFKTYIEVKWDNKSITTPNFPKTLFSGFYVKKYADRMGKYRTKVEESSTFHGWPIIQNEGYPECRLFYDLKKLGKGKIRNTIKYYIEDKGIESEQFIYIVQPDSIEEFNKTCLSAGIDQNLFKNIDSIQVPKKPKTSRTNDGGGVVKNCRAYDPSGELDEEIDENKMANIDVDLKDHEGGYYMLRNYSSFYYGKDGGILKELNPNLKLNNLYDCLLKFDSEFADHPVIYTFGVKNAEKLGAQWKRIDTALDLFFTSYYTNLVTPKIHYRRLDDDRVVYLLYKIADELKSDELNDIISRVNFNFNDEEQYYNSIAQTFCTKAKDFSKTLSLEVYPLNNKIRKFKNKFPMLQYVDIFKMERDDFQKDFLQYARGILGAENNIKNLDQVPEMV